MGDISGKVVFITGAARGQGRSHAVRFAAAGADVAILDICGPVSEHVPYPPATPDDLAETVKQISGYDVGMVARQADVREFAQVKSVVDEALSVFGRIDVVVANAGIYTCDWVWEVPESAWDATVDTNLKGLWNTVRAVVPAMISAGRGGSIIITSAESAVRGHPLIGHYAATKMGQIGLMKSLATELAPYSIRVNTVNPLAVNTPMTTGPAGARITETLMRLRPGLSGADDMGWVEPDDVSDVVLYLASEKAQGITGVQLPVEPKAAGDPPS
ncbi:mycofactocin-coupled SDR family oxidoreductase [Actinomadura rubrisoli]|uniref:NAD(P)-dependent oxidoreductase n=1 Tax=Actinomadura rubrisoli TaxID=2530368 RepID=A0A4R5B0U2_9ACTN|nr:mycofactocin-coupled SDR family oxidoreductase [Actinomadura rubrisoli]TDD79201.1 NAD(P)-dependent oxidoreductase [Actinomadura rubrisoli]